VWPSFVNMFNAVPTFMAVLSWFEPLLTATDGAPGRVAVCRYV